MVSDNLVLREDPTTTHNIHSAQQSELSLFVCILLLTI